MSRSVWKSFFIKGNFFKNKDSQHKIWSKSSIITSKFKNQIVFIHNGNNFKKIYITSSKVGLNFGNFINTRKYTNKYCLNNKKQNGTKK